MTADFTGSANAMGPRKRFLVMASFALLLMAIIWISKGGDIRRASESVLGDAGEFIFGNSGQDLAGSEETCGDMVSSRRTDMQSELARLSCTMRIME